MRSKPVTAIYMQRPRVPFNVWWENKQRRSYEKDVRVLACWLSQSYWRRIPEKKATAYIEYFLRKIEKRHEDFHVYPGDKSSGVWVFRHTPRDWDYRQWRHIVKRYNGIKRYKLKSKDELAKEKWYP